MTLPPHFENPVEYFEQSLLFFREYQHLYNFANTEILIRNVLKQINTEGFTEEEVFSENFTLDEESVGNEFLDNFFAKLNQFRVAYEDVLETDSDSELHLESTSVKKKHEIIRLADEIGKVCEAGNCETVVDLGSGLGYLDQVIHETTSLKVLGLECNEGHYIRAKKRQRKYHIGSTNHVKFIKHTVNENSDLNIDGFLIDKFGRNHFCITGLHACADLSIDGANLFLKMPDAKAIVLMPCCYHKMALVAPDKFKNFPLSDCLRSIFEENKGYEFLKIPFLRLAAQPPSKDEKLSDSVFNLLARATLEVYAYKHNCKLKRKKRKAVRTKSVNRNFLVYLQDAVKGFSLIHKIDEKTQEDPDITINIEELIELWRETETLTLQAAIFVLVQNYLQPIFENFILYDRLIFMQENGIKNSIFKKIFNDKISPRCLALVSIK